MPTTTIPGNPPDDFTTNLWATWGGRYTALCEHGKVDIEYYADNHYPITSCGCPPGTPNP